jgi:hypothetical protein
MEIYNLYIALYSRPSGVDYHWSFYIPIDNIFENGIFYHVTNRTGLWKYESINKYDNYKSIICIIKIGHIKNKELLNNMLKCDQIKNDDDRFTCRTWILDSVKKLNKYNTIKCNDLTMLEDEVLKYARNNSSIAEKGGKMSVHVSKYCF